MDHMSTSSHHLKMGGLRNLGLQPTLKQKVAL
jgi:hypothetical protein